MALALTAEHLLLLVELISVRLFALLELLMQVGFAICGRRAARALIRMSSVVRRLRPSNCSVNECVVDQVDAHICVLRRLRVVRYTVRHISLFTCCIFT